MVASSGGKVVKNVAGYDLGKLFSGSRGRLGLIARVSLRLHPRPASSATVVADGDARAAWEELRRSQLEPNAVDLLPGRLAMLFEGPPAAVEAQVAAAPGRASRTMPSGTRALPPRRVAAAREPFDWQECVLARPGPGIAYVAEPREPRWSPLAERVRASFDPEGILV